MAAAVRRAAFFIQLAALSVKLGRGHVLRSSDELPSGERYGKIQFVPGAVVHGFSQRICQVRLKHAFKISLCVQIGRCGCDLSGNGPYLPGEGFTVRQAIDSFTSGGAYASFEENSKGRIEPGMLADFVILGENPFETDESRIKDIPVAATYVGGKCVFERG